MFHNGVIHPGMPQRTVKNIEKKKKGKVYGILLY